MEENRITNADLKRYKLRIVNLLDLNCDRADGKCCKQSGCKSCHRPDGNGAARRAAYADRRLVERCLAGDQQAWEELFEQRHWPLLRGVRTLLGPYGRDVHFVEEIAARVWYVLLRNDGEVLARYDPSRDSRLGAFLMGIARLEMVQYVRSERRRRGRELLAGRKLLEKQPACAQELDRLLNELISTLAPQEQEFLEKHLVSCPPPDGDGNGHDSESQDSIRQQRRRVYRKLSRFLRR